MLANTENAWSKSDFERVFEAEVAKKRSDKSYRVFNEIGRLANDYPHAENTVNKVTVWCSNDYLGMSRHPFVTSKMK